MIKTFYFDAKMEKEFKTLPFPNKKDENGGTTAHAYLLGQNKKGIVDTAVLVKADGGCHWVPRLYTDNLVAAQTVLIGKNRDFCGILRVVKDTVNESDGNLIYRMLVGKTPDFFMLSIGTQKRIVTDVPNNAKREYKLEIGFFNNKGGFQEALECRYEFVKNTK